VADDDDDDATQQDRGLEWINQVQLPWSGEAGPRTIIQQTYTLVCIHLPMCIRELLTVSLGLEFRITPESTNNTINLYIYGR